MSDRCLVLANFGGPRTLSEVRPFLEALLTDRDVVRTPLPQPLHNLIFRRVAKKRAKKVSADYQAIGGSSPIYADTEAIGEALQERLQCPVFSFHRYLPSTHDRFFSQLGERETLVFPLFPQFTYATTGSIARLFAKRLSYPQLARTRWIKSYPTAPPFIAAYVQRIREAIRDEASTFLLFSAHGVPRRFIADGDLYRDECEASYRALKAHFPKAEGLLAFQSQFGPEVWIDPYTEAVAQDIATYAKERREVLVVPLTFTSDHIETLFEIEEMYLPPIRAAGYEARRVEALNRAPYWIDAIADIIQTSDRCNTEMLVRRSP